MARDVVVVAAATVVDDDEEDDDELVTVTGAVAGLRAAVVPDDLAHPPRTARAPTTATAASVALLGAAGPAMDAA